MSVGFLHTRHAAQQHARRPAEDRLPTGGIFFAVGPGDPVGGSEKIHTGEAEMRQRRSRFGELYYLQIRCSRFRRCTVSFVVVGLENVSCVE